MIFVILGTQKFQFNRLLRKLDELIDNSTVTEEVFAQIGYSDYEPQFYNYVRFMDQELFLEMEKSADLIITHGGTGAVISAVKNHKKVIAVPRQSRYGEHVDDHQKELVEQFTQAGIIESCNDMADLGELIRKTKTREFNTYISGTQKYLNRISTYIENL